MDRLKGEVAGRRGAKPGNVVCDRGIITRLHAGLEKRSQRPSQVLKPLVAAHGVDPCEMAGFCEAATDDRHGRSEVPFGETKGQLAGGSLVEEGLLTPRPTGHVIRTWASSSVTVGFFLLRNDSPAHDRPRSPSFPKATRRPLIVLQLQAVGSVGCPARLHNLLCRLDPLPVGRLFIGQHAEPHFLPRCPLLFSQWPDFIRAWRRRARRRFGAR